MRESPVDASGVTLTTISPVKRGDWDARLASGTKSKEVVVSSDCFSALASRPIAEPNRSAGSGFQNPQDTKQNETAIRVRNAWRRCMVVLIIAERLGYGTPTRTCAFTVGAVGVVIIRLVESSFIRCRVRSQGKSSPVLLPQVIGRFQSLPRRRAGSDIGRDSANGRGRSACRRSKWV